MVEARSALEANPQHVIVQPAWLIYDPEMRFAQTNATRTKLVTKSTKLPSLGELPLTRPRNPANINRMPAAAMTSREVIEGG